MWTEAVHATASVNQSSAAVLKLAGTKDTNRWMSQIHLMCLPLLK